MEWQQSPIESLKWIKVLPIHIAPQSLETLTSWLRRLASANYIGSLDSLMALCFPAQERRVAREQNDFSVSNIQTLAILTNTDQAQILATTFYHLGRKFGRSTQAQALSRFLHGCINSQLRFCPLCISGTGYYKLSWRFNCLIGCAIHGVHLLDQCPYCNKCIPLLSAPFSPETCPFCLASLAQCFAPSLDEDQLEKVKICDEELNYLITPQWYEVGSSETVTRLGEQIARTRRIKRKTASDIAYQCNMKLSTVEGIERGDVRGRGALFSDYLKYTRHLGTNLRTLFAAVDIASSESDKSQLPVSDCIAEVLLGQLTEIEANTFVQAGDLITQKSLGSHLGMTPQGLKKYPGLRDHLVERATKNSLLRKIRRQEREEHLLRLAAETADKIRTRGERLSQRAIARSMNIPWSTIRSFPRVKILLRELAG